MKHNYFRNLLTALLLLCSTVAFAHDFGVDGIYYNITDATNKTVEVTMKRNKYYPYLYEQYTGDVVIPKSVTYGGTTYSVTSIDDETFCCSSGLTSVVIPSSVTSIGRYAFSRSSDLISLIVADGNTVYDSRDNCNAIIETATNTLVAGCKNTVIPNSVTGIGNNAFEGCTGFTSVEIGNNITSIGDYAFAGCSCLTSVEIPNSVTGIGNNAFYECQGLTSVAISYGVTSIGEFAFGSCTSLANVEIPNSVTNIGNNAFIGCTSLTNIVIPDSLTSIAVGVFGAAGLTSIEIPNSVTSIGGSAFNGCPFTSVVIPNSVTSIGDYAFAYCFGLTSVTIGNSVTSIGGYAFESCSGLTSITSLIPAEELIPQISYAFYGVDKNACTLYVPLGAKSTYASTSGWSEFTNIVELVPTDVTITINQYGNATYCSPYALDFSNVEGLKAYAATGYKANSQVVTLTRVQTAEAGIGLFLKGEPGEYLVPIIESTDEHTLNLLVGTLEQTTVNSTDGEMSNYKFTITDDDAAPMFYPFEDSTPFSAGKAYLQIPTAWLLATAQKSLSIRFDDGETTDIDDVEGNVKNTTIYDLQGRAVENPTSGVYIIDGKKVIIK